MTEQEEYNEIIDQAGLAPAYSEVPIQKSDEKFLEQLNPEKICEFLENLLRGKKWNTEKECWEDDPYAKKVNEYGVAVIMRKVRSIVNPNTIYGNLDQEIIENIIMDFVFDLSFTLAMKYKEFEIEINDISTITKMCADVAYIALTRGVDAITLRLLRSMIETKEVIATTQKPAEKGFLEKFFKR